jgi:hypothetical protein
MPKKLPIVSSMKESEISVSDLRELVKNYKGNSPFLSKCVWISKDLLEELAKRNNSQNGFRIYFAGFEWDQEDKKRQEKESSISREQNFSTEPMISSSASKADAAGQYEQVQSLSTSKGPKKYQGLIFVSTDDDQEDMLMEDNYVIVGEKVDMDDELQGTYALKICPPPPPNDCKGDL